MRGLDPKPVSVADTVKTLAVLDMSDTRALHGISVHRPIEDLSLMEARLSLPWEWTSCGGEADSHPADAFALLIDGKPAFGFGAGTSASVDDGPPEHAEGSHWYQAYIGGETRYFGLIDVQWAYGRGHSMVMMDGDGKGEIKHVLLHAWGC